MDEAWVGVMAEVKQREVEQVDHKQQLTRPEMSVDPENDEGESQEVVL